MTSARSQFESALRLAAIYHADEGMSGWLLSEEQFEAIMKAADKYRAAGQPAVTAPARGASRPAPAPRDGGGTEGYPSGTGALSAGRERIAAAIVADLGRHMEGYGTAHYAADIPALVEGTP